MLRMGMTRIVVPGGGNKRIRLDVLPGEERSSMLRVEAGQIPRW